MQIILVTLPLAVPFILLGIWSSKIVKKKGRKPVKWFFAGFLLGFFGILAAYLTKRLEIENNIITETIYDPAL